MFLTAGRFIGFLKYNSMNRTIINCFFPERIFTDGLNVDTLKLFYNRRTILISKNAS